MKKFKIEVTETLSKFVEVKAKNIEEAIKKTKKSYRNEKIILDENNYITTEFKKNKTIKISIFYTKIVRYLPL